MAVRFRRRHKPFLGPLDLVRTPDYPAGMARPIPSTTLGPIARISASGPWLTAKALPLTIPQSLLLRADEVIQ